MPIGLLGALELQVDGRLRPVNGPRRRSLLAPYGGALGRQGGGYRLDDDLCQVDAVELDRAVDAARRAQNPTADEVTERLRRAVGASRGTFCEDVPLLALEGDRVHYAELQVTAMEMLFDDARRPSPCPAGRPSAHPGLAGRRRDGSRPPDMEGGSVLVGRAHDCDIRMDWDPLVCAACSRSAAP